MKKTLFEKIWDEHIVQQIPGGPTVIYIDKHFIHEVTSPQAFSGLEKRGLNIFRKQSIVATADHNVPTLHQNKPIQEELSRLQVDTLISNCQKHHIDLYGLEHPYQGIVHVIGPELGITQPGMTIVCGDSHTSTHGAFGSIAFGIGTSEVEMVLATQSLIQTKPKQMKINIDGTLNKGVVSKDIILYILSKISASGATGYFIEYTGSTIRSLSMEARMTICNMSIEMGARGGLIAPDQTTFDYINGKIFAPKNQDWQDKLTYWKTLYSDENAFFDKVINFDAKDIKPMVTYGTNPGMGIAIDDKIPALENFKTPTELENFMKSLNYMGFVPNQPIENLLVQYVFIGSCTNARIEDFRLVAALVKGRKKSPNIKAYIVPGSNQVAAQIKHEGLDTILQEAGFEIRQPGCSACLGMNEDKIPAKAYCVSTSNRNFEGRQGAGARTILASPLTAMASALTGKLTNPIIFL
ncbi:MAG: 3-isopropylmalate dehydratase large subunit [Sediminibacterium sp.]|nr:3-isopropylmalate dehydratase large subunit [Sediminibacterium sp.]